MTLQPITCNHCGAPLEVSAGARFATCAHCGSRLAIHRTPSAAYTEVMEQIGQHTERMAESLDTIRLQNELERLDREWQMERETLLVRSKNGSTSEPSAAGGMIGAGIAAVFGVFWTIGAASMGAPAFMVLFGMIFVALAIFGGVSAVTGAQKYSDTEEAYRRKRDEILRQLDESR